MENTEKVTIMTRFKSFISQCVRVWHLLKKPDRTEFETVAKVSAIGLGAVGALGFVIAIAMKFVKI
jgi:protein translocase SEC61 complex gamma subunit